jgi:seryl-tRNA synthetase
MIQLQKFIVELDPIPQEMAQEEIQKRVVYLSPEIRAFRFVGDGSRAEFSASQATGPELKSRVQNLARSIQRGLRGVSRKVVYRSRAFDRPKFAGGQSVEGVHMLGLGQAMLEGLSMRLFQYFDRRFAELGQSLGAQTLLTPTLIPGHVLGRANYFRNFPGSLTFACHLPEAPENIEAFSKRHADCCELDSETQKDLAPPKFGLSPATCLHVYHRWLGQTLPGKSVYGVCGRCFRYESSNMTDLRRLWEFTMREIVFLGQSDWVRQQRDRSTNQMAEILEELELAGEIRTASDPFFVSPDSLAQTWFQLASDSKYEISLRLPDDQRLAVGSYNLHGEYFGRQFEMVLPDQSSAHSACVAFGLERWIWAFIAEHGQDISRWPRAAREAPEFAGC